MAMYLIVGLLVAIVLLLCTPMKQRNLLLQRLVVCGSLALAAYYLSPFIAGLLAVFYDSVLKAIGWPEILGIGGAGTLLFFLIYVGKADREQNRAIRAGSVQAFDARVENARAVEVTTRIRDEK
jgi:hypothetical protein